MGCVFRFAQRVVLRVGGLPWLGISVLGVLTLSPALLGQTSPDSEAGVPLPTDWSHHHLVFSRPATVEQFMRVEQDPRYWQQLLRQSRALPEAELDGALTSDLQPRPKPRLPRVRRKLKRDWSVNMDSGATVGAGQYPAKFSYNPTAAPSCANDFVVFNTSLAGSGTQASIIAYKNLYVGCAVPVPAVNWAYNTGGTLSTSVTLSIDGTQVAFVQTPSSGSVQLVVLKWKASTTETASLPLTLSNTAAGSYRACVAPCMTTLTFVTGPSETAPLTDTNSSPYYDFSAGADADTLYVGDDQGYLHQFTGVFSGSPAETSNATASAGWPSRAATASLSSPVFDAVSGNVFVTASWTQSVNSGGRLHAICVTITCGAASTTTGTPFASSKILGPANTGTANTCHTESSGNAPNSTMRVDTPLVDSSAQMVYVFMGNDGTGSSAVYQFSTSQSSISASCGTETTIGTVASANPDFAVLAGAFDNLYFSSNGSSPTGNLYVCGNTAGVPTLYQVRITSNAMAPTGTSALAVSTGNTTCSPVTEVFSGTKDWIFLSVQSLSSTASPVNCPSTTGCLMSFSVPTTPGLPPSGTTATLAATGGTSGIVIDNTVTTGPLTAAQVYFSPLGDQTCGTGGKGGCAVQASQSALH
jgi:hypothetical protein